MSKLNLEIVSWSDVYRVLECDEARSWALQYYFAAGFSQSEFQTQRKAKQVMADAMTYASDQLEMMYLKPNIRINNKNSLIKNKHNIDILRRRLESFFF